MFGKGTKTKQRVEESQLKHPLHVLLTVVHKGGGGGGEESEGKEGGVEESQEGRVWMGVPDGSGGPGG